ncbi:MAG: DNA alkylation repair protein, partial [Planctomycetota bacterium]
QNLRHGSGDNQYGVRRGEVRKLAKEIKADHDLALELWETGNIDARFLAVLIMKPKSLSAGELDRMVRSLTFVEVADWLNSYVVKKHPDAEGMRQGWMDSGDPMAARAGWNLTSILAKKSADGLDLAALLDCLESEMGDAPAEAQWTMNFALVEIGINHPEHRKRALAIGEAHGLYQDYPVAKGCTSPFAPTWINEMVSRQG